MRAQAAVLDRLLGAVTSAYEDELRRAARSPEQRRVERVRGLLEHGVFGGGESDDGGGDGLDGDLGYALGGWHVGVIAVGVRAGWGGWAEGAVRELAAGVGCRLLCVEREEGCVWAWLGAGERSMLADVEGIVSSAIVSVPDDRSESALGMGEGVVFALGEPSEGLRGWRLTHLQARAALVVARRRPRRFTRYRDVALLASALKDGLLGGGLIDVYLAPLREARGDGAVLRQTLRAYLVTEHSVSSTAAALGVGRKTVESRLQMIEECLGRTLHPFPAELEIALLLDELARP